MEYSPSTVLKDYEHLFSSPIDSMFALIPIVFWEVMVVEINRYADDYLKKKRRKYVCGYCWTPVSVADVLNYLGMLIFSMLYPQTG
jgi:hypothetical protein